MTLEKFKNLKIPDKPGVYFFLKGKEIIYIGKATSLRDRVKSYFGKDLIETRGPLLVDMVFKADQIKYEVTDSVLEALILEANLIKKYQPKYNTKEKSDKSFNYVCITKEELPKIILVRGKSLEPKKYENVFGPYPNGSQLREALKIIRKIFPFLDDKSKNYLEFYKQINLVPDLKDQKLYRQNIKNIILFFGGKKKKVFKNLEKEMKEYAKHREFEKAGEIKRQIFALKHINDVALLKNNESSAGGKIFDPAPFFGRIKGNKTGPSDTKILSPASNFRIEAYDIAHMGGKNMVGVMVVIENGEVEKSEYKKFRIRTQDNANDTGALAEVLARRLSHTEWTYPSLVVVDGGVAQINAAKKVLKNFGVSIPIISVLKDERHKPKAILSSSLRSDLKGAQGLAFADKYKREILLANSEAHRFAIAYHKKMRNKSFLG
jgi:excinuclease ABC subunit C